MAREPKDRPDRSGSRNVEDGRGTFDRGHGRPKDGANVSPRDPKRTDQTDEYKPSRNR